jgi:hypothetical protein
MKKTTTLSSGGFIPPTSFYSIFSPLITLIKTRIIAMTSKRWMKLPTTWNPMKPTSQRITRIVAIVVNIF